MNDQPVYNIVNHFIFRIANCDSAMSSAQLLFEIPLVVTPQNLSSHDLDEL